MQNYILKFFSVFLLLYNTSCNSQEPALKTNQDEIIAEFVDGCAKKFNYKFQMDEWQNCLDKGLEKDSTIAYLWQQKAMPYFKARKYGVGMDFLDKAVRYDEERWLPYRAFIKCIFVKDYSGAIRDFESCIEKYGNHHEMDHLYSFYIGISYLQLNEFIKAENHLKVGIIQQEEVNNEAHFLDYFYYGISLYEQKKWEEAIISFDKSLHQYSNFSDAKFYKSVCLYRIGDNDTAQIIYNQGKEDALNGYTINEDNSIYEVYPYKVRW